MCARKFSCVAIPPYVLGDVEDGSPFRVWRDAAGNREFLHAFVHLGGKNLFFLLRCHWVLGLL